MLQHIEEEGNDASVDDIGKHGADDWYYEEGLDGVVVFVAYSTHVSHGVRRGTKGETADACTEYC